MKPISKDDNASIATDLVILVVVVGGIGIAIWLAISNAGGVIELVEDLVYATGELVYAVIAGTVGGLFKIGKDVGNATAPWKEGSAANKWAKKWNPVTAWRDNKKKEGRSWYTLYLW